MLHMLISTPAGFILTFFSAYVNWPELTSKHAQSHLFLYLKGRGISYTFAFLQNDTSFCVKRLSLRLSLHYFLLMRAVHIYSSQQDKS